MGLSCSPKPAEIICRAVNTRIPPIAGGGPRKGDYYEFQTVGEFRRDILFDRGAPRRPRSLSVRYLCRGI